MNREITSTKARALHAAIRSRYNLGQPEGYGIVCGMFDEERSGSTYRTPRGLYSFDVTRTPHQTKILFTIHR